MATYYLPNENDWYQTSHEKVKYRFKMEELTDDDNLGKVSVSVEINNAIEGLENTVNGKFHLFINGNERPYEGPILPCETGEYTLYNVIPNIIFMNTQLSVGGYLEIEDLNITSNNIGDTIYLFDEYASADIPSVMTLSDEGISAQDTRYSVVFGMHLEKKRWRWAGSTGPMTSEYATFPNAGYVSSGGYYGDVITVSLDPDMCSGGGYFTKSVQHTVIEERVPPNYVPVYIKLIPFYSTNVYYLESNDIYNQGDITAASNYTHYISFDEDGARECTVLPICTADEDRGETIQRLPGTEFSGNYDGTNVVTSSFPCHATMDPNYTNDYDGSGSYIFADPYTQKYCIKSVYQKTDSTNTIHTYPYYLNSSKYFDLVNYETVLNLTKRFLRKKYNVKVYSKIELPGYNFTDDILLYDADLLSNSKQYDTAVMEVGLIFNRNRVIVGSDTIYCKGEVINHMVDGSFLYDDATINISDQNVYFDFEIREEEVSSDMVYYLKPINLKKYTIKFNHSPDGGVTNGYIPRDKFVSYDEKFTLANVKRPTKSGCSFYGWTTNLDAFYMEYMDPDNSCEGSIIKPADEISLNGDSPLLVNYISDSTLYLYPVWKINKGSVYISNDGKIYAPTFIEMGNSIRISKGRNTLYAETFRETKEADGIYQSDGKTICANLFIEAAPGEIEGY